MTTLLNYDQTQSSFTLSKRTSFMSPEIPRWNRILRYLLTSALLLEIAIILTCVVLSDINAKAGYLQHRIPAFLFWVYVWVGISAPIIAITTLITLWAKKKSVWNDASDTNKKSLRKLMVLCVVNACAFAVWLELAGLVFFGAGGNR